MSSKLHNDKYNKFIIYGKNPPNLQAIQSSALQLKCYVKFNGKFEQNGMALCILAHKDNLSIFLPEQF